MTVRRRDDGTIVLDGDCGAEDAEPLLQSLLANPAVAVDWTACRHLHTAVVQIILAAAPALVGPCGDRWVGEWIVPER